MLRINRQKGVVTLMLTIVILMVVTLTTLYTSRVVVTDDRVFANAYRNNQALDAARSGFDYALAHLIAYPSVITDSQPSGLDSCFSLYSASLAAPGPLANGSTYTMTYGCVTAGSTTYLTITAMGISADGSATKTVRGTVKVLSGIVLAPIISNGNVTTSTSTGSIVPTVTNSIAGQLYSIAAGGTITNTAGTYSPASTLSSNAILSVLTASQLETNYAGNRINDFSTLTPSRWVRLSCSTSPTYNSNSAFNAPATGTCSCTSSSANALCTSTFNNISNPASNGGVLIYVSFTGTATTFTLRDIASNAMAIGTATSPIVLVVDKLATSATGVFVQVSVSNLASVFFGNIYTNIPLTVRKFGGNTNTTLTVNGLVLSSGALTVTDATSTGSAIKVTVNGEEVGNGVTHSSSAILLNSTSLGYIIGSYNGYVGSSAISGFDTGSSGYGLVAGSSKDF